MVVSGCILGDQEDSACPGSLREGGGVGCKSYIEKPGMCVKNPAGCAFLDFCDFFTIFLFETSVETSDFDQLL